MSDLTPSALDDSQQQRGEVHAVIDLSMLDGKSVGDFLDRFTSSAALFTCPVTVSVAASAMENAGAPYHVVGNAVQAFREACERAGRARAHLLVLNGPCHIDISTVHELTDAIEQDEQIGMAHPRFATSDNRVVPLDEPDGVLLDRAVLGAVPATYVTTERLSACVLMSRRIVSSVAPDASRWSTLTGICAELATRTRRLGFRTLVCNRAVATLDAPAAGALPSLAPDEASALRERYPELERSFDALARTDAFAYERKLSLALSPSWSLLIDGRNLPAFVNGTTKAALGLADGLIARRPHGSTFWVSAEAAAYHRLVDRYPTARISTTIPEGTFGVAIRLGQPWTAREILDLHRAAAINVYVMLDTIAWDIVYPAPPELDGVWRLLAASADGIAFISRFTRDRFVRRFPLGDTVLTDVVHLSLNPEDFCQSDVTVPDLPAGYWLVVGNHYDHKYVRPTVELLRREFPSQAVVAVGDVDDQPGGPKLQKPSGDIDEAVMQGLYAHASTVVYPSFYEGFGLPIVNTLSYGGTIVVRDSALIREVAGAYVGPGRMVAFDTDDEFVRAMHGISKGEDLSEIPLMRASSDAPYGWKSAGRHLERFLETTIQAARLRPAHHVRALAAALLREGP